jgi:hypothetical protein
MRHLLLLLLACRGTRSQRLGLVAGPWPSVRQYRLSGWIICSMYIRPNVNIQIADRQIVDKCVKISTSSDPLPWQP